MKTLLTGAAGLVGSTIPADVQVMGRKPPFPEYKEKRRRWCDLTSFRDTHNLFQETLPTHVIHTAAKVGGLGANLSQMGEFFYVLMRTVIRVMRLIYSHIQIKKNKLVEMFI